MTMRFLVRPKVRDRESLASHLVRVSKMNGYVDPFDSRRVWRDYLVDFDCGNESLMLPLRQETALTYCQLADIEVMVFIGMTPHRFAAGMLPPDKVAMQKLSSRSGPDRVHLRLIMKTAQVSRHLRPENRAAYCPMCLREGVYHRVDWQPRVVTMCAEHGCYLRELCPDCKAFVGVADVAWGCCRKCGARLAAAPYEQVDATSVEYKSQRILRGWLHRDGSEDDLGVPSDQMAEPMNALYYLVLALRTVLMSDTRVLDTLGFGLGETVPVHVEHHVSEPKLNARVLAAAYHALTGWPTNFHRLLDAVRVVNESSDTDSLRAFKSLYSRQLSRDWKIAPFAFVQTAFDEYMINDPSLCASFLQLKRVRGRNELYERGPYLTLDAASEHLGIGAKRLGELMHKGVLRQYNNPKSSFIMVSRSEVEALRNRWNELLSLMEVRIRLGICYDAIIALIQEGLLDGGKERGPSNSQKWEVTASSVEKLIGRVSTRVEIRPQDRIGNAIDLVQAVQRTSTYGMTIALILKAVVDGELNAFVFDPDWRLGNLMVEEREMERFVEALLSRLGWVTREEFACRMGVKRSMITKWVVNGLVVRTDETAEVRFFDADYVARFVAEHVFSEAAAAILGIAVHTVTQWAVKGRLHPVSGPGIDDCHRFLFRRSECWELRPENRLSSREAAALYGINVKAFMQWIEQGKVTPISGPGIDRTETYVFLKSSMSSHLLN